MGSRLVVTIVTLLTLVQPLATDLYLAALPAIRNEYDSPVSLVQRTFTALVLSFGVSQLFWGPASDRFGRRPVMFFGLVAYGGGALLGSQVDLLCDQPLRAISSAAIFIFYSLKPDFFA